MRLARIGWLLLLLPLGGCGGDGSYSLRIVFPDQEAREESAQVGTWAMRPGGRDCAQLEGGAVQLAEMDVESSLVVEFPHDPTELILEQLPTGNYLFFAEAQTGTGARILRGCTQAEVRAGVNMQVTVALRWVCRPLPVGEIPQNGFDDDCDGKTDEQS